MQIYLGRAQREKLRKIAADKNKAISELIREAVEKYIEDNAESNLCKLKNSAGIWNDREDIDDSVEYVRSLRQNWRGNKGIESE